MFSRIETLSLSWDAATFENVQEMLTSPQKNVLSYHIFAECSMESQKT